MAENKYSRKKSHPVNLGGGINASSNASMALSTPLSLRSQIFNSNSDYAKSSLRECSGRSINRFTSFNGESGQSI
ncbi:MAG: hypothetical protein LBQ01_04660 [Prevotellaceae bacterium]|nr:hypothetical protein [Prevotellaceae bacterium]